MISAGNLTTPIAICEVSVTKNEYGEQSRVWIPILSTRCAILKRAGRRSDLEGNVAATATRSIILRYREGITIRHRVKFLDSGEIYAIEQPEPSRRDGSLTLHLKYIDE